MDPKDYSDYFSSCQEANNYLYADKSTRDPCLEKMEKAYKSMSSYIGFSNEKTATLNFHAKEITHAMERFIISKASDEALSHEVTNADPEHGLNARFPNLRAPSFQTCIEDVLSFTQAYANKKMKAQQYLTEIDQIIKDFLQYSKEIKAPSTCQS